METDNPRIEAESSTVVMDQILDRSEFYQQQKADYAVMQAEIKQEKDDAKLLKLNDKVEFQKYKMKRIRRFTSDIYDTFRSIQFQSDRLQKAWDYFYQGQFPEMYDVLDADKAREEVKAARNDSPSKDKDWRDKAYNTLRACSYELLIKALYQRTLVDRPNWKEESHDLLKEAYDLSGNVHTLYELGVYLHFVDQHEEAAKLLDDAYELASELEEEFCILYQAKCLCVKGYTAEELLHIADAVSYATKAAKLYYSLYEKKPFEYRFHRIDILEHVGEYNLTAENYAAALSVFEEAVQIRRNMVRFDDYESEIALAEAIDNLAISHFKLEEYPEAIALCEESIQIKDHNLESDLYTILESKAKTLETLTEIYQKMDDTPNAILAAEEKMKVHNRIREVDPYGESLEIITNADLLCGLYTKLERYEDAIAQRQIQVDLYKIISEQCPGEETLHALGEVLFQLALLHTHDMLPIKFVESIKDALKVFRQLMAAYPESDEYRMKTGVLLYYTARCYEIMRERHKMRATALEASQLLSSVTRPKGVDAMLKEMRRIIVTRW
jgi:tetratricopeptide (TPR) repeat protein